MISGRLLSVFEPSWSDSVLATLLQQLAVGYDYPELYLGSIIQNGSDVEPTIWLRVSFSGVPSSSVQRVNDRVALFRRRRERD